jgi:hypothetical protein
MTAEANRDPKAGCTDLGRLVRFETALIKLE